ncbi:MAG: type II toxin-antitoxin system RelE/ParE family toxin [Candidatus Omnitrophica bacterium]|nr:type II toxin-antitoxin system RelE/ParE family toxin [Candidatus Omnitrophota bacterium]
MKYFLGLQEKEREFLRSLPPDLKKKIRSGLDAILSDPFSGKALIEDLHGLRSYRIGDLRIIYKIDHTAINIVVVGPRKTIYQKALFEIRRSKE